MQKTKIEWVKNPDGTQGFSWNPIKGLCPVNCWYCYAKPLYDRFNLYGRGTLERIGDIGYLAEWELEQPIKRKKPAGIFVCSTYELFHSPDKFARDEIFKTIEQCPQLRFYILTKLPENIDRPMPDNVWLGVTSTGYPFQNIFENLSKSYAKRKFISFEPFFTPVLLGNWFQDYHFDWIIVGRLTGHGHKHDPERIWIEKIVEKARKYSIPIFLKNNLKKIWGESLIQELPK